MSDELKPDESAEPGASDVVLQGQHAWSGIKTNAVETREMWRRVGAALNHGRALHQSNKDFGAWCDANGFDMKKDLRADAMWLADNWPVVGASEDASHPTWIRKTHRATASGKPAKPPPRFESIRSALSPEHFKPEHAQAAADALSALDGVLAALESLRGAMAALERSPKPS